ncbi:glycosyltransferase family 8 protein [Rhizobium leucaenae]|uniref:Lipopolysaccharide biosynthesis glycosyltransferase n=1 Tax=Rhizobium leucaenae TaxID=29450 RepID=A0A7W7EN72_9HYPH|nr:glycosyltransferase family 8 protein [Rhizobium leucaenae]MBB4571801.1 lipopolysaccharide biosynthesis glycosyltransferase [Rhizobium leucaenae]
MVEPVGARGTAVSVRKHPSFFVKPSAGTTAFRHDGVSSLMDDPAVREERLTTPPLDVAEVVIAFGIDAGYLPHAAVAMTSLIDNARGARFRFLIVHDGISIDRRADLERCAPGQRFEWLEITDSRLLNMEGRRHVSRAAYHRLALPDLAPADVSRIVYLDADVVVIGDIRELWNQELGDCAIGGVYDVGIDSEAFAKHFRLPPKRLAYFNSGILLLDLAKIRQSNEFSQVLDLLETRFDELDQIDQDALNIVFWGRWKHLDPLWNVQRRMLMQEGRPCFAEKSEMANGRRPKIIHFTEHNKPWSIDGYHPYIWKYYHYLRRTPYWEAINKVGETNFRKSIRRRIKTTLIWALLKP